MDDGLTGAVWSGQFARVMVRWKEALPLLEKKGFSIDSGLLEIFGITATRTHHKPDTRIYMHYRAKLCSFFEVCL